MPTGVHLLMVAAVSLTDEVLPLRGWKSYQTATNYSDARTIWMASQS
jgi:hypothetical protein